MSKKNKVAEISPEVRAEVQSMFDCVATSEEIASRRARWRGHVANLIAECDANKYGCYVKSSLFEEVEGRPLVEVILDSMVRGRSSGFNASVDRDYDNAPTRTRNNHDRQIVCTSVHFHLERDARFSEDDILGLVRRFYRRGDVGIKAAIHRAVRQAVAC